MENDAYMLPASVVRILRCEVDERGGDIASEHLDKRVVLERSRATLVRQPLGADSEIIKDQVFAAVDMAILELAAQANRTPSMVAPELANLPTIGMEDSEIAAKPEVAAITENVASQSPSGTRPMAETARDGLHSVDLPRLAGIAAGIGRPPQEILEVLNQPASKQKWPVAARPDERGVPIQISEEKHHAIAELYWTSNHSVRFLGRVFGVSEDTVEKVLKRVRARLTNWAAGGAYAWIPALPREFLLRVLGGIGAATTPIAIVLMCLLLPASERLRPEVGGAAGSEGTSTGQAGRSAPPESTEPVLAFDLVAAAHAAFSQSPLGAEDDVAVVRETDGRHDVEIMAAATATDTDQPGCLRVNKSIQSGLGRLAIVFRPPVNLEATCVYAYGGDPELQPGLHIERWFTTKFQGGNAIQVGQFVRRPPTHTAGSANDLPTDGRIVLINRGTTRRLKDSGEVLQFSSFSRQLTDTDNDGLLDFTETALGTNPAKLDTDDDGVADSIEVSLAGTNPLNADSDRDGTWDGDEIRVGRNPLIGDGFRSFAPGVVARCPDMVPVYILLGNQPPNVGLPFATVAYEALTQPYRSENFLGLLNLILTPYGPDPQVGSAPVFFTVARTTLVSGAIEFGRCGNRRWPKPLSELRCNDEYAADPLFLPKSHTQEIAVIDSEGVHRDGVGLLGEAATGTRVVDTGLRLDRRAPTESIGFMLPVLLQASANSTATQLILPEPMDTPTGKAFPIVVYQRNGEASTRRAPGAHEERIVLVDDLTKDRDLRSTGWRIVRVLGLAWPPSCPQQ